ncbi:DUF6777 domain-containing protein [Streptomyces racemochromogenes]|uniref:DUF6777 domain-containing protein n=1 Tax=Streptomyces racemochromogenes TaxID=67353 RepID=A0ABW7PM79_9ACTN
MPRLVTAAVAVVAVAALAVVLTRPGGSSGQAGGEVFLQPAAASGPDPFTDSTAARQATPPPQSKPPGPATGAAASTAAGTTGTRSVSGSAPGLYGGTRDVASCDVEKQIAALSGDPAKNAAFASALGLEPGAVPGYLRGLSPLQLRLDTRVTNHGYRDGTATPYQAVLQAGTAVLVDDRGVPRVRCVCGNPLGPPVALKANPKRHGQPWSAYEPEKVVAVAPAEHTVNAFVIYDHQDHRWLERGRGASPKPDKPVPPPAVATPVPTTVPPSAPPASAGTTPPAASSAPSTAKPTGPASGTATEPPAATATGTPSEPSSEPPSEPPSETATEPYPPATTPAPATPPPAPATTPPAPPANPY